MVEADRETERAQHEVGRLATRPMGEREQLRRAIYRDPYGEAWGRGRIFGIVPLPDERVYWFATESTAADQRAEDERETVRERFGDWHAPILACIDATPVEAVLRHDIYDLTCLPTTFVKGRAVLLVVGGAAMALAYDQGRLTRDVDALFVTTPEVRQAAEAIAAEHGLEPDWLNDAAKGFLPGQDEHPTTVFESRSDQRSSESMPVTTWRWSTGSPRVRVPLPRRPRPRRPPYEP